MSDVSTVLSDLVAKAKLFMQMSDDDTSLLEDAIAVYCDDATPTSATVEVTDTTIVLVDSVTGTTTLTMADADKDTMTEMVTAIDAVANWNATLLCKSDAATNTLQRLPATSALGQGNEITLLYTNDELLELLITNIWAGIEKELDRDILSTTFSELYRLDGDRLIVLNQPELSQVTRVAMETEDGLTVTYTGSDEAARVEVTATSVVLTSRTGSTTTTSTILFTAQVTTTAMAVAVSAVAGWTGTVKNARPSAYLVRSGSRDADGVTVTLEVWDDWDGDYRVQYEEGIIELEEPAITNWMGASRGMALIEYTAGFATLPADIEQAILEAVQMAWTSGRTDLTLESERLGDYSYKRASGSNPAELARLSAISAASAKLECYRRTRP